jgi:hypothetical protein
MLLNAGADVNAVPAIEGKTALEEAMEHGRLNRIRVQHGVRIQYTGSVLLGLGVHDEAVISILLSLPRVLLRAHATRLA